METEKVEEKIKGFKGFDKDLKCRGFQYEIGKEYETDKKPIRCTSNGFHFCENPLDIFSYYPPSSCRFAEVEGDGEVSKDNEDSKIAVSKIKIGIEISLQKLIESGIKFIFERTTLSKKSTNIESKKHASNSGYSGAAMSIGAYASAETNAKDFFACGLGIQNKAKASLGS